MSKFAFDEITAVLEGLTDSWYMFYVIVDKSGYITSMNKPLLEALGRTREEVEGRYILDVIPDCQICNVLQTGRVVGADICSIKGRDTIVTALPIMHQGEVLGALARSLFLDMSGAQVFMKRLQDVEREFAVILDTLFENPYIGFVMLDREGMITHMNKNFMNIMGGLRKKDVIGKYILDVVPNSELPQILATGRIDQASLWNVNGHDTLVTRMPIKKDGEIIGAIGHYFLLDMSGTQVLMDMLKETEERFTMIIEGLIESPHLAYVIVDKNTKITFINQTYLDILGRKREDCIGHPIQEITSESKLPEVLRTGKLYKADHWPVNGRDLVVSRQPITKNGEIIGAIGQSVVLDMSGAKILTRKLEEIERELNIYKDEVWSIYRARWQFRDLTGDSTEFSMTKDMARQFAATQGRLSASTVLPCLKTCWNQSCLAMKKGLSQGPKKAASQANLNWPRAAPYFWTK